MWADTRQSASATGASKSSRRGHFSAITSHSQSHLRDEPVDPDPARGRTPLSPPPDERLITGTSRLLCVCCGDNSTSSTSSRPRQVVTSAPAAGRTVGTDGTDRTDRTRAFSRRPRPRLAPVGHVGEVSEERLVGPRQQTHLLGRREDGTFRGELLVKVGHVLHAFLWAGRERWGQSASGVVSGGVGWGVGVAALAMAQVLYVTCSSLICVTDKYLRGTVVGNKSLIKQPLDVASATTLCISFHGAVKKKLKDAHNTPKYTPSSRP